MIKPHTETPTAVIGEEGLTYEDWPPRALRQGPVQGYGIGGATRHPAPPFVPRIPTQLDLLTASPAIGPASWVPYPGVVRVPPTTPQSYTYDVEPIEETERDVGGPAPPPSSGASPGSGNASGDSSPSDVGRSVTDPWVAEISTVITQQYGATDYTGEPSGHGAAHWHAGVDLGYGTGTIVTAPVDPEWWNSVPILSLLGNAVQGATNQSGLFNAGTFHHGVWNGTDYVPDPQGYGSHAATLTLMSNGGQPAADVILGHGLAYHAEDGGTVRPGDALISVDTEGNASGPHLHFEVRPYHGTYGSDIDPWAILTGGGTVSLPGSNLASGIGSDVEAAAGQIAAGIKQAENDAVNLVIGTTMVGGGVALLGLGAYVAFRGFQIPSVPAPQPAPQPAPPPSHPAARVARATRAAPARPQIPGKPSDAVPRVNSSREAARARLGPSSGFRNERELARRSRGVAQREIAIRQRVRAGPPTGSKPPF